MTLQEEGGAAGAGGSTSGAVSAGGSAPANVTGAIDKFDPVLTKMARRKKLVEEAAALIQKKVQGK